MAREFTRAEQVGAGGLVRLRFGGAELTITPDQLRILYALAESDWGWLPLEGLAKKLEGRPAAESDDRVSRTRAWSVPQREGHLEAALSTLSAAGLVSMGRADGPAGEETVTLTDDGLALITGLTKHWTPWQQYCQRFGLERY